MVIFFSSKPVTLRVKINKKKILSMVIRHRKFQGRTLYENLLFQVPLISQYYQTAFFFLNMCTNMYTGS